MNSVDNTQNSNWNEYALLFSSAYPIKVFSTLIFVHTYMFPRKTTDNREFTAYVYIIYIIKCFLIYFQRRSEKWRRTSPIFSESHLNSPHESGAEIVRTIFGLSILAIWYKMFFYLCQRKNVDAPIVFNLFGKVPRDGDALYLHFPKAS